MRAFAVNHRPTPRRWQRGLSIVEVMVALTLGLVAVGGAAAIYLANRRSFATVESVARLEENERFALDLLSREIREAGNSVCGGAMITTNLVTPTPNWATWGQGLLGDVLVSAAAAGKIVGPTGATAQAGGNSLLVWSGSSGGTPVQITAVSPATNTLTTNIAHGFSVNDVIVACDGSQLITFAVASNTATSLTYTGLSPALKVGGYLNKLSAHIWYVGGGTTPPAGTTSLRRLTIDKTGSWGASDNDEMLIGVKDMQISYLEANASGTPTTNDYVSAANVVNWSAVAAVRLNLTLATLDQTGSNGSAATVITHELPMTVNLKARAL